MEAKFFFSNLMKNISFNIFNNRKFLPNIISCFYRKIIQKKSHIIFGISTALFLSNSNKNKSYCISSNEIENLDLEEKVKVIQFNANTPIEDRYIAVKLKNIQGNLLAVFDGHGGDSTAQFVSEMIAPYVDSIYAELVKKNKNNEKTNDELITQAIFDTFHKIEAELLDRAKKLYSSGEGKKACNGACALAIIVTQDKLFVAQLGDSKAKLYKKIDDRIISSKLTRTYNCEKPHQQLHLFKNFTDPDIVVCKRDLNKSCYVKGRLQPTRSFGDFHLKSIYFNRKNDKNFKSPIIPFHGPYISAVPDISIFKLEKNDYGLILATDGFWDNFKSDEVAKFIEKNIKLNSEKFLNALLRETLTKASISSNISLVDLLSLPEEKKRNNYDDTTIIFYKF